METLAPNPTKIATKWALFYLLISIVLTYGTELLNLDPNSPVKYLGYIPFIAFCFLAQKEYKDQLGGYITFGQGFSPGFRYSLFSGLLIAIFIYVYLGILSPDVLAKSLESQQSSMVEKGMSQEQIDKASEIGLKYGAIFGAVFGAIGTLIFGAIVSLVGAAILKKEKSVYDLDDTTTDVSDPTV